MNRASGAIYGVAEGSEGTAPCVPELRMKRATGGGTAAPPPVSSLGRSAPELVPPVPRYCTFAGAAWTGAVAWTGAARITGAACAGSARSNRGELMGELMRAGGTFGAGARRGAGASVGFGARRGAGAICGVDPTAGSARCRNQR